MKNIYENLLELDRKNDYQIFNSIRYDDFEENKYFNSSIDINMKYNSEYQFNEDYQIKYDEYNIMIYDLLENNQISDIERFSLNHIQFEDDKSDYIISSLIDRFFQFFIIYLENENRIEKSKKYFKKS